MGLNTTKARVAIAPTTTALVIIDLQTYFLSPLLEHPNDRVDLKIVDKLLTYAIPACRYVSSLSHVISAVFVD